MSCTTILVGKKASYDGSTIIARNDDASAADHFTAKKLVIVRPEDQPRLYKSVQSHVEIPLPDNPMRYSAAPDAVNQKGIWADHGVNEKNVGMTATETISSNERVLAADPLVEYDPKHPDIPGGIGEEDIVVLVLPYISSAREGVKRLGSLLETYGTYEMNGIAFSDSDEIWWLETIGGHHWMARRVPDTCYAVIPNQLGLDRLDLNDALGAQKEYMCSADLREFIEDNHLDLSLREGSVLQSECGTVLCNQKSSMSGIDQGSREAGLDQECSASGLDQKHSAAGSDQECGLVSAGQVCAASAEDENIIDPRLAFGSHDDSDHVYNTPRAWYMLRYFNPRTLVWDGPDADYRPEDDDLPWCMVPERKITIEDVKYILSSHYQGTPYDPYLSHGDKSECNKYRTIGINRTDVLGIIQIRPYLPEECKALQWISFGSNAFNAAAPFYSNVTDIPQYLSSTTGRVETDNWYWSSRLIAALADASWQTSRFEIEHYSFKIQSEARRVIVETDKEIRKCAGVASNEQIQDILGKANQKVADILKAQADQTLDTVLQFASDNMKNRFARADA